MGDIGVLLYDEPAAAGQVATAIERVGGFVVHHETDPNRCRQRVVETDVDCLVCNVDAWPDETSPLGRTLDDLGELPVVLFRTDGRETEVRLWGQPDAGRSEWKRGDVPTSVETAIAIDGGRSALADADHVLPAALDAIDDAFFVFDADSRLRFWNDVVGTVSGLGDDQLRGRTPESFVVPEHRDRIAAANERAMREGSTTVEADVRTADGGTRPYEFTKTRLVDEDGDFIGHCGVGRDIADRRFREQQLSVLHRFLRHNLRNELNVILGHADVLGEGPAESRPEAVSAIRERVHHLLGVADTVRRLEDLLSTGVVAGEVSDLVAATESELDAVRRRFPSARVETDLPATAPVVGHPRLPMAVEQVVANAVEHNDRAEPLVSVTVERGPEWTTLSVADDGPGIPAVERGAVTTAPEDELEHGSGLGLYVVGWLLRYSDGHVEMRDREPRGSVVSLTLPSATVDE